VAALADDFERAMRDIYRQASAIGYRPSLLLETIGQRGGVDAARQLTTKTTEGFTRLLLLERLDLTVEALMLKPQWTSLFTEEELRRARRRLSESGYDA
jgi:hypothetical protein